MRDGIEEILKEGGNGIGLWMVTLGEERGRKQRKVVVGWGESKQTASWVQRT